MKWLLAPLAFSVLSALASPVPGNNGNGNNDPNDCHNPHNNCGKGNSNGNKSLGQLAARKGKYFGTEISSYYFAVANFSRIENEQFNQVTPENEGKWEVIHPQQNTWNFTGMDLVMQQAKKQGAIVRGHNFCWDSQTPSWVTSITDPTQLKAVLKDHITTIMKRYGKQLYAIDVVNEPLNEDGTWKKSVWYNVLGEDYIGIALDYAHAAAPHVKLYINDYNIEGVNAKSKSLLAISKKLLAQKKPLHGIGFESHFIGGSVPQDIAASMKQFTDIGLDVAITELDVRVPIDANGLTTADQLAQQAKDYAFVTEACLANKRCPGVTVWGFNDGFSWVPGVFKGEGAACMYDLWYQPKPAFYSTQAALK